MSLSGWEELTQHAPFLIPHLSNFLYFLYGVPVLLAISAPHSEERSRLFSSTNGVQAGLAAHLTYIAIFLRQPFTSGFAHPISESLLVRPSYQSLTETLEALQKVFDRP
jgi:hypothetical protein